VGDGVACDVNECAAGTHGCHAEATCTDAQPGFTCACNRGYLGDGVSCSPDPETFVADLDRRPVTLTVNGASYEVRGLSRVAVLLGFVRSPQERQDRPVYGNSHEVPPITARRVLGDARAIEVLEKAAGEAAKVSLRLTSVFGEDVEVQLTARVEVTDRRRVETRGGVELAEIVLHATRIGVGTIAGARPDLVPRPVARMLEISGITGDSFIWGRFAESELPMPAESRGGLLAVHNLRELPALWQWVTSFLEGLDDYRSLSVIQRDTEDREVFRNNAFECMPAELRFFDPTKAYGETLLGELVIATGLVERG
jgi:hypothetical protein